MPELTSHNVHCNTSTNTAGDSYAHESLRSTTLCAEFPANGSVGLSVEAQASLWRQETQVLIGPKQSFKKKKERNGSMTPTHLSPSSATCEIA